MDLSRLVIVQVPSWVCSHQINWLWLWLYCFLIFPIKIVCISIFICIHSISCMYDQVPLDVCWHQPGAPGEPGLVLHTMHRQERGKLPYFIIWSLKWIEGRNFLFSGEVDCGSSVSEPEPCQNSVGSETLGEEWLVEWDFKNQRFQKVPDIQGKKIILYCFSRREGA